MYKRIFLLYIVFLLGSQSLSGSQEQKACLNMIVENESFVRMDGCRSHDPDTFVKGTQLLEKALAKEPNNSRYAFYLALTYYNAGNYPKALEKFQKRIELAGCEQEVFWSKYAVGMIQEFLNFDIETITKSYCDAYVFRPIRAEPLFRLAQLYRRKGNDYLGFIFSGIGMHHSLPKDEAMLDEAWIYDYGLKAEYAMCTRSMKQYQECLKTCHLLLSNPNLPSNLKETIEISKQQALEGIAKLQFGSKSALSTPDSDFSQVAYGQQDMSTCEKHDPESKSSNLASEASFAIPSLANLPLSRELIQK